MLEELKPYFLDMAQIKQTNPQVCGSIAEMARAAGFRRPESILRRVPAGKKLVPILTLVDWSPENDK